MIGGCIYMSLELFSNLSSDMSKEDIDEILNTLKNNFNYQQVYVSEYGGYGLIRCGDSYIKNTPPLFEIAFLKTRIILSVFGDLNDLRIIKEQIENFLASKNIIVCFEEE